MEVGKQRSSNMFSFAVGLVLAILAIETGYLQWKFIKMEERFTEKIDKLIKERTDIEKVGLEWFKEMLQPNRTLKQGKREKRDTQQGSRERGEKKEVTQTIMVHGVRAFINDVINKKAKTKAVCIDKKVVCVYGEPGDTGKMGFSQPKGAKGDQGIPGDAHDDPYGIRGLAGPTGPKGEQGRRGLVGHKGERGQPGDCRCPSKSI
eukprot:Seg1673.5 transcript_id=Seg1673.5/GoldUCD/mRNA.D3Y31 product="Collagen alpha-2 chain" protein_id=Seg1673.5/GoldUCD/D3Y31